MMYLFGTVMVAEIFAEIVSIFVSFRVLFETRGKDPPTAIIVTNLREDLYLPEGVPP